MTVPGRDWSLTPAGGPVRVAGPRHGDSPPAFRAAHGDWPVQEAYDALQREREELRRFHLTLHCSRLPENAEDVTDFEIQVQVAASAAAPPATPRGFGGPPRIGRALARTLTGRGPRVRAQRASREDPTPCRSSSQEVDLQVPASRY